MGNLSPLASVSQTRAVLDAYGLSTKYSFGQNFLINDGVLERIIALADVNQDDFVLEVGPGIGTLTIALLKNARYVLSIEKDRDLPAVLAETCAQWSDQFELLSKDALDFSARDAAEGFRGDGVPPNKLVANLPYAVAATVVLDYFQNLPSIESATVMVQKEVADRMFAQPGTKNYSAYTVKLHLLADPVDRFLVGPGSFFPPPRVDSSVIRLNRKTMCDEQGQAYSQEVMDAACRMADAAFANRRKTISNSCKTYFASCGERGKQMIERLPQLFEMAEIDPKVRGEVLELESFIALGKAYLSLLPA